MRRLIVWLTLLALALASCVPAQMATPVPGATRLLTEIAASTPAPAVASPTPTVPPTATPPPSPTPTATPTPIPTLEPSLVGGLEGVPDPRVTNPELFDLTRPDAPIPQFVNAMQMAGIEVTTEEVAERIAFIDRKADGSPLVDKNGNQFVVGVYNLDPDPTKTGETLEGPIPLFIAKQDGKGRWEWRKILLKDDGIEVGAYLGDTTALNELNSGTIMFDWSKRQESPKKPVDLGWVNTQINRARTNGLINLIFNDLYYPGTAPPWLREYKAEEELLQVLEKHFRVLMKYGVANGVTHFNVYNEPYLPPYRSDDHVFSILQQTMTPQEKQRNPYFPIIEVFQIADKVRREIESENPGINIKLGFSNASGHWPNGLCVQQNIDVITALAQENLVDYLNVHSGVYDIYTILNTPEDDIVKLFKAYQVERADGKKVEVVIGEFLISLEKIKHLPLPEQYRLQAEAARKFARAARRAGVTKIHFWGMIDGTTEGLNSHPFDRNLNPKPFYYGFLAGVEFFDEYK